MGIAAPVTMMTYNLGSIKIANFRERKNCAMGKFLLKFPSAYVLRLSDLETTSLPSKYSLKTKVSSAAVEN